MEKRWKNIDDWKRKCYEENLPQLYCVHQKLHREWPGTEPGCRGEGSDTNRQSHGTAFWQVLVPGV